MTNDKFRDFIEKQLGNQEKLKERKWIKDHSISYTFNDVEFLPNPDSKIFYKFQYEEYRHYPLDILWDSSSIVEEITINNHLDSKFPLVE